MFWSLPGSRWWRFLEIPSSRLSEVETMRRNVLVGTVIAGIALYVWVRLSNHEPRSDSQAVAPVQATSNSWAKPGDDAIVIRETSACPDEQATGQLVEASIKASAGQMSGPEYSSFFDQLGCLDIAKGDRGKVLRFWEYAPRNSPLAASEYVFARVKFDDSKGEGWVPEQDLQPLK